MGSFGCATFSDLSYDYQGLVQKRDFENASELLDSHRQYKKNRNKLLYYLEKGTVLRNAGRYEESNVFLNKADLAIEDFEKKILTEIAALSTNDGIRNYRALPYEQIMVHYYKVLNYLALNKPNEAVVEAKRLDILSQKLQSLQPKLVRKQASQYAFLHFIIGFAYEQNNDAINAFIAYRNAVNFYLDHSLDPPKQLIQDLLHMANNAGYYGQQKRFEKKFQTEYTMMNTDQTVIFWENGLSPIKEEWSLNFTVIDNGETNTVLFTNEDFDFVIPFQTSSSDDKKNLLGLQVFRAAFPKYTHRIPSYQKATITADKIYQIQPTFDLSKMVDDYYRAVLIKKLGKTVARFALKRILELKAQEQGELAGLGANLIGAITEKTDTRYWQTLPSTISYSRITTNTSEISLELSSPNSSTNQIIKLPVDPKNKIVFFHSLAVEPNY